MSSHTIQVHLTNRCNMQCPYCYIHQESTDLTLDDFKAQFAYVLRLSSMVDPSFKESDGWHIAYFGGEPLLNLRTVWEINDYLRTTGVNVEYEHMQTNALLMTEDIKRELGRRHIAWSYSFDGVWDSPESIEAHERLLSEGVLDHQAKIMIASNHVARIVENYQYFVEHGWTNPDMTFVRDDIWDDASAAICGEQVTRLVDLMIELTKADVGGLGRLFCVGFIELALMDIIIGKKCTKRDYTCFAMRRGFSFTPERIVYPCSRFYHNKLYPLLDANTGQVFNETIEHLRGALSVLAMKECEECSIRQYCNTGCAYIQLCRGDGQCMRPVKHYCTILKHVYREALRYYQALRDVPALNERFNAEMRRIFKYE